MATYILGVVIVVCFGFGIHRIYKNFSSGKSDCCGSSGGCGGGCSKCHSKI